jgi:hypothetical protein
MSTRVGERVDDWTDRPFSGGYRELQGLAESDFSGVVRAGGAELFMTRGTVVGIRRGSIDDFEDGSGTLYKAPADALPLLAIMQERSDEVRAEYYSEDTAISEVDRTLESGGFTGYIKLSENVLSGDYYLVYHQGHSMAIAYVGNSQQLLTDDEAFERADDEIGIYQVRPVDIDPIEIPEPAEPDPEPEPEPAPSAGVPTDDSESTETTETVVDPSTEEPAEPAESRDPMATPDPEPTDTTEATSKVSERTETTAADELDATADVSTTDDTASETDPDPVTDATEADDGDDEVSPPVSPEPERSETREPEPTEPERTAQEPRTEDTAESTTGTTEPVPEDTTVGPEGSGTSSETDRTRTVKQAAATQTEPASTEPEPTSSESAQEDAPPTPTPTERNEADAASSIDERSGAGDEPSSLETRAIPSLDPERTSTRNGGEASGPRRDAPARADESAVSAGEASVESRERHEQSAEQTAQTEAGQRQQATAGESTHHEETQAEESTETTAPDDSPEQADSQPASSPSTTEPEEAVSERIDELQELLGEREKEINRLESSLETAESERDSVRRELKAVREERDELSEQVEKLESELQRLEDELGAATDAQQRMTPQEALSGTDIFVRYRSKGDATLEKAHQSGAVKKDVVENLRLEKHTQFDADISAVGGREYDEFLEDTVAFEFVTWIVEDLIFEIQGTGHTDGLSELYDALPKINRIELNGAVNVTYTEDGQETQGTESFDIVFRERMGDPLLVANINDSRQGASQAMMEDLITAAERVGRSSDQFASAFLVTESFFEPEALETVAAATRGGILSRDKRKSFVNLSRKRGYHLCLVEARNQNFHLEVPEL